MPAFPLASGKSGGAWQDRSGRTHRRARALIGDRRGNVTLLVATAMPLLIGAAAIGLDTMQLTMAKQRLQRAADSAALAGAYARTQNGNVQASVTRDLALNNRIPLSAAPAVENAPSQGPHAGDSRAVRVALSAERAVPFMSFFTGSSMAISVDATAAPVASGRYCVVSLDRSASPGVTFAGNADVNLGCGVATNATGPSAISVEGSPRVTATPISAVGGVPPAGAFQGSTTVIPYNISQLDPFAGLANPVVPSFCSPPVVVEPGVTASLAPGCYAGMTLKGSVTLQPGTYYLDGGQLLIESQAKVVGVGVTFVLTSRSSVITSTSVATVEIKGGAQVELKAPAAGEYKGLLIYQDRRAAALATNYIRGNSASVLDGAFYFHSQRIVFEGSSGMQMHCLRMVGRQVSFAGSGGVSNSCPSNRESRDFEGLQVRIVS